MKALLQRVCNGEVAVEGMKIGETGQGLLILVCAVRGDEEHHVEQLALKITKLRIFKDEAGKMNRSILDIGGGALVVSQFTLAADTSRGNRPGFSAAAPPDIGEALYLHFAKTLETQGVSVATGQFGADMQVALVNDGPVTIWLET